MSSISTIKMGNAQASYWVLSADQDFMFRGTLKAGRRTGRSLPEVPAQAGVAGRGKSELQRAVCRITSGTRASKPVDG
jgi:hypothetical protein